MPWQQISDYIKNVLGTSGHDRHYAERFIQAHLAELICKNDRFTNGERTECLLALADSIGNRRSELAHRLRIVAESFRGEGELSGTWSHADSSASQQVPLALFQGSTTFARFHQILKQRYRSKRALLPILEGGLEALLKDTQLVITNTSGSGHTTASRGVLDHLSKQELPKTGIEFDMMMAMRCVVHVGKRGREQWNRAMKEGKHARSRFYFFKSAFGKASTGDLNRLNRIMHNPFIMSPVKQSLREVMKVFSVGDAPPISTQPLFLEETVDVFFEVNPDARRDNKTALQICLTDIPANDDFWERECQRLNSRGVAPNVELHKPASRPGVTLVGKMNTLEPQFKAVTQPISYFREGIIQPNSQKVTENLGEQNVSKETLDGLDPLALISLGSSVNPDYITELVRKCQDKGFVPVVLCGGNETLKAELAEQSGADRQVIPLSRVNDHVMGWLNRKAKVICLAGGGMTILELLAIKERDSGAMQDQQIVYHAVGDLVVRPPNEEKNLAYLTQIWSGRVHRSDAWNCALPNQERRSGWAAAMWQCRPHFSDGQGHTLPPKGVELPSIRRGGA